jgi:predicted MFS family arabinose efflux permease
MNERRSTNPVDHLRVFIGAVLLSGVGNLMYEIASQFSFMMGTAYGYSEGSQGDFTACFFVGYTLIPITMIFWIRRVNWRSIGTTASLFAGVGFLTLNFVHSYAGILVAMFTAGIGLGASYALTLTVFGDSDDPDRGYGIKFFFDVLPGAAMNLLVPIIYKSFGFHGVSTAMVGWCLLGAGSSLLLPARGAKSQTSINAPFHWGEERLAILACFGCFVLLLGVMALWAFLGQIGTYKGFSITTLGPMLAVGSVLNASGALIAAGLGQRFGRLAPVVVTIAINIVMLWLLGSTTSFAAYATGSLIFCLTNNYTLAYAMGIVASLDRHGRFIPFTSACFSTGAIFGPLFAGHLLERFGLAQMLLLPALAWLCALAVFTYCYRTEPRGGRPVLAGNHVS